MPITYTNRRGHIYYLHEGTTKSGKPKYYFAKKSQGHLADTIPDGYEIYENPNSQVFLRRIPPKVITDAEQAIVARAIKKQPEIETIVDIKKNIITIYTADQVPLFGELSIFGSNRDVQEFLARNRTYTAMMRFILVDKEERSFIVERYCFRGAIDDWIQISATGSLEKLAQQYIPHLGQDSFYELHRGL